MEPIIKQHPIYQDEQLLTSNDLNSSFDYLEQQIRLTRSGTGIIGRVVGHEYELKNNNQELHICPGLSVSIEGNILLLTNNADGVNEGPGLPKVYKYYTLYEKESGTPGITVDEFTKLASSAFSQPAPSGANSNYQTIEETKLLLTEEEGLALQASGVSVSLLNTITNWNDWLLALYLEEREEENSNCNQNTCNDEGVVRIKRTVPLLVRKVNDLFPAINTPPVELVRLYMKKLEVTFESFADVSDNDAYINDTRFPDGYALASNQDNQRLNHKIKGYLTELKVKLTALASAVNHISWLDKDMANLMNASRIQEVINLMNLADIKFYWFNYYLLGVDISLAANEFIDQLNTYFSSERNESISQLNHRRQRFVVLGAIPSVQGRVDLHRYYPISIDRIQHILRQQQRLNKFYNRIWMLIFSFGRKRGKFSSSAFSTCLFANSVPVVTGQPSYSIKITPSKYHPSSFGECSIPYFYSFRTDIDPVTNNYPENSAFLNHWKADSQNYEIDTKGVFSYYDADFPTAQPRNTFNGGLDLHTGYPFYRVEGVVGKSVKKALTDLSQIIRSKSIPISVVVVHVVPIWYYGLPIGAECIGGVKSGGTLVLLSRLDDSDDSVQTIVGYYSVPYRIKNNNVPGAMGGYDLSGPNIKVDFYNNHNPAQDVTTMTITDNDTPHPLNPMF